MLATTTAVAPRRRELDFQLFDVLRLDALLALPYFAEHDRATLGAVLDTAYDVAGEYFAPCAAELDTYDFRLRDGEVVTPASLKAALRAFVEAGFLQLGFPADRGGLQLPATLGSAVGLIFSAANNSANAYAWLTIGAANLLAHFGSEEQRARWMAPMIEGRYFGTMALSEPQACAQLARVTRALLEAQAAHGPERALAESTAYLDAFGTIAVAWRWLAQARAAAAAPASDFTAGKLAACRYFQRYELPRATAALERLAALDDLIFTVRPAML